MFDKDGICTLKRAFLSKFGVDAFMNGVVLREKYLILSDTICLSVAATSFTEVELEELFMGATTKSQPTTNTNEQF